MSRATVFIARLAGLFRRDASEQELDVELRFHLDMRVEEHLCMGMSPDEARAAALRDFGGIELTKERYRESRGILWLETSIRDVVYALRSLAKDWLFCAVAVLSLMLGIGGNVAIFSLADTVLVQSLAVRDPGQLRFLEKTGMHSRVQYFSVPYYRQMLRHSDLSDGILAFFDAAGTLQVSADTGRSDGNSELVHAQLASGNYFRVLGVTPIAGRDLLAADDSAQGRDPAAVISYSYWQRRFGGAATAIGAKIRINGIPFTVMGVTPPEFAGLTPGAPPDITVPLRLQSHIWLDPGSSILDDAKFGWLRLMLRLRTDVSEQKAQTGLSVVSRQIHEGLGVAAALADHNVASKIDLLPGQRGLDSLRLRFSKPILVLMALVGFVLLLACTNIAVLLLARAAARQREIGTRVALGATPLRLMRQLLTESLIVAIAGALLGCLLAYGASQLLMKVLAESPTPIHLTFAINRSVLLFTASLTLVTTLICGLLPAVQATRLGIASSLSRDGLAFRHANFPGTRVSYERVLAVFQVAFSLVLLAAAALFIRSLSELQRVNAGFGADKLLLVTIDPSLAGYRDARLSSAYTDLLGRMRQIPGIVSATMTSHSLLSPGADDAGFTVRGRTPQPGEPRGVNLDMVGSHFFETMKIPLELGRGITDQDTEFSPRVAVITESIARQYFPGQSPIGKRASVGGPPISIVGVTPDVKFNSLHDEASHVVYLPYGQRPPWHPTPAQMTFVMRTVQPDPDVVALTIRQLVNRYDRDLPIVSIKTAGRQISESLVQERLLAWLSGGFGVLGLILACVGVAGTMAHAVSLRSNEIAIRMAIGAQRSQVIWTFLKQAIGLSIAGSILGLVFAHILSPFAESLLFSVKPTDLYTELTVAILLIAFVIAAALLPSWRASQIDPIVALRRE